MNIMKLLLIPIMAFLMMGCEHSLQIQGKGDIVSASQQRNCTYEQQPCDLSIVGKYVETYTAKPRAGWLFDSWEGCNSTTTRCSFNVDAETVRKHWGESYVLLAKFKQKKTLEVYCCGATKQVTEGETVTLKGVIVNPTNERINIVWRQIQGPAVTIKNATTPNASFTAPAVDEPAVLRFLLLVSGSTINATSREASVQVNPMKTVVTDSVEDSVVTWSKEINTVGGHRVFEVRYNSTTNLGAKTSVSGWIAKPNPAIHPMPADGYPVMAFAHGTTGLADMCAPTNNSRPEATIPLLLEFLDKGFVVVATDYQGLGTEGIHHYLNGISEGHAVLDSIRAAREFANGGKKAVLFGHSQGGHAVVFANELAKSYAPELNIVGTIGSGTGIVDSQGLIIEHIKHSYYKGYLMMVAVAQNAAYGDKEVPLSRWLTPAGIEAARALSSICVGELVATYGSLSADYLFVEGAPLVSTSNKYDPLADATPGLKVGASPLLMIHGRRDPQIPSQALVPWIEETCGRGQDIYLKWFDTGHRVPYEAPSAVADFLTPWIEARFDGLSVPSNCDNIPRP